MLCATSTVCLEQGRDRRRGNVQIVRFRTSGGSYATLCTAVGKGVLVCSAPPLFGADTDPLQLGNYENNTYFLVTLSVGTMQQLHYNLLGSCLQLMNSRERHP